MAIPAVERARQDGDLATLAEICITASFPSFRRDAEEALSGFGGGEVAAAVLEFARTRLVHSEPPAAEAGPHREAVSLIVRLCGSSAMGPLLNALEDTDLLAFAATVLGQLADEGRLSDTERTAAHEALRRLAADLRVFVRSDIAAALQRSSEGWSLDVLADLAADEESRVRRSALASLAKRDTERALHAIGRLVADPDPEIRLEAARCLQPPWRGHRGDPDAFPRDEIRLRALAAASSDADGRVRECAVRTIGGFPERAALPAHFVGEMARVLETAAGDPEAKVRRAALRVLSRLGGPIATATIRAALARETELRDEAALSLIGLPNPQEAASQVLAVLEGGDEEERIAVARAIGADLESTTRVSSLLSNATYRGVLSGEGVGSIVRALHRLASTASKRIRAAAVDALAAVEARLRQKREESIAKARRESAPVASAIDRPRQEEPSARREGAGVGRVEPVSFTVFHPTAIYRGQWQTLLAYAHLAEATHHVMLDSQARLAGAQDVSYWRRSSDATAPLKRGATLRVVPHLPGARFNPAYVDLDWLEDCHVAEFRMQADGSVEAGRAVNGAIQFRVGPLLIGEVGLWAVLAEDPSAGAETSSGIAVEANARMYSAIFPSYAREDEHFVRRLESAYSLLNVRYLRDVTTLRAGDAWEPRLRELIDEADVLQLCWSSAAKRSRQVEREWRYALGLEREGFIKPIYWSNPPPEFPPELSHLHFQYWDPT